MYVRLFECGCVCTSVSCGLMHLSSHYLKLCSCSKASTGCAKAIAPKKMPTTPKGNTKGLTKGSTTVNPPPPPVAKGFLIASVRPLVMSSCCDPSSCCDSSQEVMSLSPEVVPRRHRLHHLQRCLRRASPT